MPHYSLLRLYVLCKTNASYIVMRDACISDLNNKISIPAVELQETVTVTKVMDKTCDGPKTELMFYSGIARRHPI